MYHFRDYTRKFITLYTLSEYLDGNLGNIVGKIFGDREKDISCTVLNIWTEIKTRHVFVEMLKDIDSGLCSYKEVINLALDKRVNEYIEIIGGEFRHPPNKKATPQTPSRS